MANLSKLDVVNGCLKTMGESPLNAIDNDHPFVQAALLTLATSLTLELARGWWFNTDIVTLKPDAVSGFIYVPADILALDTPWAQLTQRGRRLFDQINNTFDMRTFMGSVNTPVIISELVREIPFEDLPTMAKYLVAARTWLDFQASYDSDAMRYRELNDTYTRVNVSVSAQNIRNANNNPRQSPGRLLGQHRRRLQGGWLRARRQHRRQGFRGPHALPLGLGRDPQGIHRPA